MLTISTDLWNGALTNWSPGFQIEYLINIVALFCRQKLWASFLCSLCMVSAGWKSGSLFLVGGIFHPLIKAAGGLLYSPFYFFSPTRMTPVVITRQPCWISVAVTDEIWEDNEMATKRKLHFSDTSSFTHRKSLHWSKSGRKWSNWRYPKLPEGTVAQCTLKSVHFANSFRNTSNYIWVFFFFSASIWICAAFLFF